MKRLTVLMVALLCGITAVQAQKDDKTGTKEKPDTNHFRIGDYKVWTLEDPEECEEPPCDKDSIDFMDDHANWAGIDIAMTSYFGPGNDLTMSDENKAYDQDFVRSIGWSLNLIEKKIDIADPYFGIVTGFGFDWKRYSFERGTSLLSNSDSTWAIVDPNTDYEVNKLKVTYIRAPLLLEFNTHKVHDKSFHFSAGVIGAIRIHTKHEQQFEVDGTEINRNTTKKFNVNPFKYGLTARIGYGQLNLFAEYSMSELFENGEGPELYPFSAGITIVGF